MRRTEEKEAARSGGGDSRQLLKPDTRPALCLCCLAKVQLSVHLCDAPFPVFPPCVRSHDPVTDTGASPAISLSQRVTFCEPGRRDRRGREQSGRITRTHRRCQVINKPNLTGLVKPRPPAVLSLAPVCEQVSGGQQVAATCVSTVTTSSRRRTFTAPICSLRNFSSGEISTSSAFWI